MLAGTTKQNSILLSVLTRKPLAEKPEKNFLGLQSKADDSTEESTPLTTESRPVLISIANSECKKLNILKEKSAFDTSDPNGLTGTAFHFSSGKHLPTVIAVRTPKPFPATSMPKVSTYGDVMRRRWLEQNSNLSKVDKQDIANEVPLVNINASCSHEDRNQHNAEYSQSCYLRVRRQEEALQIKNYLDPLVNHRLKTYLEEQEDCLLLNEE